MSNDETWAPDQAELDYLKVFGPEDHCILAIGAMDGITPWLIGQAAGLSCGTTTDPETQRANWSSSVSKRTRYQKQLLPHIASLQKHLRAFRKNETAPDPVTQAEMMGEVDNIIRSGQPDQKLRAINARLKIQGEARNGPTIEQCVYQLVRRVGPEGARRGLTELGYGHLVHAPGVTKLFDPATEHLDGEAYPGLEARIEQIERRTA